MKFTGRYLVRVVTLLIAVSIVSFILVSLSPVDPVQQYVGAVPNVSVEQREKNSRILGAERSTGGTVHELGKSAPSWRFWNISDLSKTGS